MFVAQIYIRMESEKQSIQVALYLMTAFCAHRTPSITSITGGRIGLSKLLELMTCGTTVGSKILHEQSIETNFVNQDAHTYPFS